MLESLGFWTAAPWIYVVVGLSVLLDVFLPVLPSGVLVITAATAAATGTRTAANAVDAVEAAAGTVSGSSTGTHTDVPDLLVLVLCAAAASFVGDLVAYRLAWRGGDRLDRAIARSRRLTAAQDRLGVALVRGGGSLVLLARFAPAGRSVVSLGAGATHRGVKEFLPWSALAGVAWAGYSVGLGYFGGRLLGTSWLGTSVSLLALFAAGAGAAYVIRHPSSRRRTAAARAAQEPQTA